MFEKIFKKGLDKAEETLDTAKKIKGVMDGNFAGAEEKPEDKEGEKPNEKRVDEQSLDIAQKTKELFENPDEKPEKETEVAPKNETDEDRQNREEELMQKLQEQTPEETEEERKKREGENR